MKRDIIRDASCSIRQGAFRGRFLATVFIEEAGILDLLPGTQHLAGFVIDYLVPHRDTDRNLRTDVGILSICNQ